MVCDEAAEYRDARRGEDVARLRRVLALRAMATGMSQRRIVEDLGISQSAVSQQLKAAAGLDRVHPQLLVEAAALVLTAIAAEHGYERLAVFGSVARGEAREDPETEHVLRREVDLIDYGGPKPRLDDNIRRETALL